MMRFLPVLAVLAATFPATATQAQSLKSGEVYSSIEVRPINKPNPVLGADARTHLAYELMVVNPSHLFMTLDKVEAVDGNGRSLWLVTGEGLTAMTVPFSGSAGAISPGGSSAILMDVSFGPNEQLPEIVVSRITTTRQAAGADGKPIAMPADSPVPATITFDAAAVSPGEPATVVEPPLRGPGWVDVNGCCDAVTSHRGAIMTVNGQLRVPERFAIDFVQLDPDGRLFTGDISKLENYKYYGASIHSVAPGRVVNLYDGTDEQVPGQPAKGITTESIGGNMLVIEIGEGVYAFYAHLQRGSLKVKLGDKVSTGQVLGLLGNTGNSTAPHLHFHLMDGPSPLNANGLPYVFTRFTGRGVVDEASGDGLFDKGEPAKIDTNKLSGEHANQLPLNNQVVNFGE